MKNKGEITNEQLEYFLGSDNLSKNKLLNEMISIINKEVDVITVEKWSYEQSSWQCFCFCF